VTCYPAVSLFTGIGGLDLGLEKSGFQTRICVELDPLAKKTVELNRPEWTFSDPGDAIEVAANPRRLLRLIGLRRGEVTLLSGGPPCQPFSKAGNWTSSGPSKMRDPRAKTIHAYLAIVEYLKPEVLLFENVLGFATRGRHQGLRTLIGGIRKINKSTGMRYEPHLIRVNSADYGVPQLRERVFVIAHRAGRTLSLPAPTHGPRSADNRPYSTAWDAIGDLDSASWSSELSLQGKWAGLLPSIPEGQNYLWHTPNQGGKPIFGWRTRFWSFLLKLAKSEPSWTVSAQPGPATGPFHWRNRLLSTKELSRLQTFPEDYAVLGNRRVAQQHLGNAVPAALAELIGLEIRRQLLREAVPSRGLALLPSVRKNCPKPEPTGNVPLEFKTLFGNHKAHPGTGLGPGRKKKAPATPHSR
jgi:DNA (cytosine-5)-methyltransferase 1